MAANTFDALEAARALEAAGMDRQQAEATAEQLRFAAGADRDQLATKADLDQLRTATKADLARLETKIENAVNRMLIAQLAIAGLLFAALKLF